MQRVRLAHSADELLATQAGFGRTVDPLIDLCVVSMAKYMSLFESDVESLPPNVKDKLIKLLCIQGHLTDSSIRQVLHPSVRILDLRDCEVSDSALQSISQCKQLKEINLNSCKGQIRTSITSEGVCSLALSCPLLIKVLLRGCCNLTDAGVLALAVNCPQLQILNLSHCTSITDESLQALGQHCSSLLNLDFSATLVTDSGVQGLVNGRYSAKLTEINMCRCVNVTDESIEAVLKGCPHIRILLFHGCPLISDRSREALGQLVGPNKLKQVTWTVY
ncbi:AMN1 homolog [Pelobates cultripes]|uniref:AMN1 homolog n=1 Tax=Pelobates cultripes TaxID=61616 RepID=A0AAD1RTX2_PELCU|nr:AMN1 homolog [Pelobates cultripes]